MPWMLHGIPSRNGITLTRSQRAPRKAAASSTSSTPRTQRSTEAPPWNPWRASPAQAVPAPRSRRLAAAHNASASAATTADGALVIARSSQRASTTTLSSSRRHAGRLGPYTRRPAISGSSLNIGLRTIARRSGSQRSSASTTVDGSRRSRRIDFRISDMTSGARSSTTHQSASSG